MARLIISAARGEPDRIVMNFSRREMENPIGLHAWRDRRRLASTPPWAATDFANAAGGAGPAVH